MKALSFLFICVSVFHCAEAFAGPGVLALIGDEKNNAAELVRGEARTAWFQDRGRVIKVCGETGMTDYMYPYHPSYHSPTKTWEAYLTTRQIIDKKDLAYKSEVMWKCDGTEDLTIYLGVPRSDPRIAKYIPESSTLLAYAVKTHEEPGGKWSKGFIWTAPLNGRSFDLGNGKQATFPVGDTETFSKASLMHSILTTHEMGHVLGNGHVSGTIMDEDIALFSLLEYSKEGDQWTSDERRIDRTRKLYSGIDDAPTYHGGYYGNVDFVAEKFGAHLAGQVPGESDLFARLLGFRPTLIGKKREGGYLHFMNEGGIRALGMLFGLEMGTADLVPYAIPTNDELMQAFDVDLLDPDDNTVYFYLPLTPSTGAKTHLSRGVEIFRTDSRPLDERLKDSHEWNKNQFSDLMFSDGFVIDYEMRLPTGKSITVTAYRNTPVVLQDDKLTKVITSPFLLQEKSTGKILYVDSEFEYFAQPN